MYFDIGLHEHVSGSVVLYFCASLGLLLLPLERDVLYGRPLTINLFSDAVCHKICNTRRFTHKPVVSYEAASLAIGYRSAIKLLNVITSGGED